MLAPSRPSSARSRSPAVAEKEPAFAAARPRLPGHAFDGLLELGQFSGTIRPTISHATT